LTTFIQEEDIELQYVFYEDYVDYCHPNHPDCVTGVTCSDCSAGFNPHLVVACNIVVFADNPILVKTDDPADREYSFTISPNPTSGLLEINFTNRVEPVEGIVEVYNLAGVAVGEFELAGLSTTINLSGYSKGVYFINVETTEKSKIEKIVIQ